MHRSIRLAVRTAGQDCNNESRIICPYCNGGSSHEKCMAVNTSSGWYVCYRASCGARGKLSGTTVGCTVNSQDRKTPEYDDPPKEEVLRTAPSAVRERSSYPLGSAWGRVSFEVRDEYGALQGHVLRSYTGQSPKALTYTDDGYSGLHFPRRTVQSLTDYLVLVEDIPSAEALARCVPTAALLGSYITQEHRKHLDKIGISVVYLALDEDASAKSIAQSRRHLSLDVRPVLLSTDPKDMTDTELQELAGRIYA